MSEIQTSLNSRSQTLAFIDPSIEDYQSLVAGVREGVKVYVLDSPGNGIDQITTSIQQAAAFGEIDAVHIFTHGSPDRLYLPNVVLSTDSLGKYLQHWQVWQQALSQKAAILLYGCQLAHARGAEFVKQLRNLTGKAIAASANLVGNAATVSNWNLEFTAGEVTAPIALGPEVMAAYRGVLATINVTNINDSGAGSLREAIALANPGDIIELDPSLAGRTITLNSQLVIDKDLTIVGLVDADNNPNLTISGNNTHRVFEITNDANFNPVTVTIENTIVANGKTNGRGEAGAGGGIKTASSTTLTVINSAFINNEANGEGGGAIFAGFRSNNTAIDSLFEGNSSSGNGEFGKSERGGGAIAVKSESTTTVTDSIFIDNRGINGGAINTLLGGLTVEKSTFTNNDSTAGGAFSPNTFGYGGAIYTDGASATTNASTSGRIEISNSRFEGNQGAGQGGGMFLYAYPGDEVTIANSTIINNQIQPDTQGSGLGGGLRHGGGADFKIDNSTFANNTAQGQGGGLWIGENSPTEITNSTFSGNSAESIGNVNGLGGAIALNNGSATNNIINTTIANNTAGFQGGGFWGGNFSTTLTNTILAYNQGIDGFNVNHHTGSQFSDGGGNIQYNELNPNDTLVVAGVTQADPLLGDLQEINGILVHPLLPASPAIDGGVNAGAPATDQRGISRPLDGDDDGTAIADIGAFEFSGNTEPSGFTLDIDDNGEVDALTDGILALRYLFGIRGDALTGSAIASGANRNSPDAIANYLDEARDIMLDVDGNDNADAITDGILMIRYMFGIRGSSMISGALAPDAMRITPEAVIDFLEQFDLPSAASQGAIGF